MKKIKLFIIATILVTFNGIGSVSAETRNPDEFFFHQTFGDLQEEVDIALEEGQTGILVMFELNDCPWCERMKATVLNQSAVQDYFRKNFRCLMMNVEGDNLIVDFNGTEIAEKDWALKHNRIRATPVFLFLDLKGERIMRFTGAAKDVEEFMLLGEFVVDGHYKSGNFVKFKRSRN